MKRTRTLFLLLALGGLSACTTVVVPPDAPPYRRAPPPQAGLSNLYIYRTGAFPKARAPSVRVDGKRMFDLPEGGYIMLTLPAGPHRVEIAWALDVRLRNRRVLVNLGDQGASYLKITGEFDFRPGSAEEELLVGMTADVLSHHQMYSWLVEMQQEDAERDLRDCCRNLAPAGY
jgi:hypothetical protein